MSSPFEPVAVDGAALLLEGVTAVKALVDSLAGDASAAVPVLQSAALTAATVWVESKLPAGPFSGIVIALLGGMEAGESTAIAKGDAAVQAQIAILDDEADAFLSRHS